MILLGAELIESWQPVLLGFAGILLFSSYRLLFSNNEDENEDLNNNSIVKLCRSVTRACVNCPVSLYMSHKRQVYFYCQSNYACQQSCNVADVVSSIGHMLHVSIRPYLRQILQNLSVCCNV